MDEGKNKNEASWSFQDDSSAYTAPPQQEVYGDFEPISWSGSEYIANQKNTAWYLGLTGFILLICAITYILTKDILSIAFIVVMGILFGVIAGRKPRELNYTIDDEGIKVGSKLYKYSEFKSFSMQHHDAIGYVSLLPFHRFHNELSIYFPPDHEEKIFNALANFLPNEQRHENYIDRLAKIIRF